MTWLYGLSKQSFTHTTTNPFLQAIAMCSGLKRLAKAGITVCRAHEEPLNAVALFCYESAEETYAVFIANTSRVLKYLPASAAVDFVTLTGTVDKHRDKDNRHLLHLLTCFTCAYGTQCLFKRLAAVLEN